MIRSILKIAVLLCNILAVIALLLAVSGQYFSPEKFTFSSYFGMFFFPLAFINLCFVIFWLIHLKWHFLLSLVFLVLFAGNIKTSFSVFKDKKQSEVVGKDIRVLTYNVMLFNYYKKDSKALEYINNSDADIVCLQEFGWHKNEKDFLSKEKILSTLKNYPYHHINMALDGKKATYGIATFSKYPIVNKENIDYESNFNSSIYSDIKVGGDTIRIFNNHLESNKLTKADKDNLSGKIDADIISHMANKLSVATTIRARQAEAVAGKVEESPYRVIVCGDFNDTPVSYTYQTICDNLSDPFVGSGGGFGITYSDGIYRFRIDYILVDKLLNYSNYYINNVKYSDHYPVFCTVKIPETK